MEASPHRIIFQGRRLLYLKAMFQRDFLYCGWQDPQSSAGRSVGLSKHQHYIVARCDECLEGDSGEFGRTRVNEVHA